MPDLVGKIINTFVQKEQDLYVAAMTNQKSRGTDVVIT